MGEVRVGDFDVGRVVEHMKAGFFDHVVNNLPLLRDSALRDNHGAQPPQLRSAETTALLRGPDQAAA